VDDGTRADSKKGPGRLRGAGLVALNPSQICEGVGAGLQVKAVIQPSSNRHPHSGAGATMGEIGGDRGGASGRLTALGLARMTVDDPSCDDLTLNTKC
jgi:hypothetical protein